MSQKKILLEQFKASIDNHWFVSLSHALNDLSAEQASWKDNQEVHSIWEITNHLIYYNQRYLQRFKGTPLENGVDGNDATFEGGTESWTNTVKRMDSIMNEWRQSIETCEEEKLASRVSEHSEDTWEMTLANLVIHHAYHTGQVVHILKTQGRWNSERGVH